MSGVPEEDPEGLDPLGLPALARAPLANMDSKLAVLSEKVDRLLHFQEDVTEKLQCVCRGMDQLEQGLHRLEASRELSLAAPTGPLPATAQAAWPEVLELVRAVRQEGAQHGARLEALFKMVVALDRAITLVGATFQNSKVDDLSTQGNVPCRKGSLAAGSEEVGSGFPALAGGCSGTPVGRPAWKLFLEELGTLFPYHVFCVPLMGNERRKLREYRCISV